jgi:rRNA maturation endonuclease Nob1
MKEKPPVSDDGPKSALELAMERLRKKDKDAGVADAQPVTDAQRAAIAEARSVAEAKLAEREILFKSKMAVIREPEAREVLEQEYRRDRERITNDRDRKIEEIRGDR